MIFNKLKAATKPFIDKYGFIKGLLLWIALLKEKITPDGNIFSVRVPGIKTPIHLRAKTSDIEAFCQIFIHGELDVDINHPVEYIIDAGANIGLSSVYLINKFPNSYIDALEIDKENIKIMDLNVCEYGNINIIQKGLWGTSEVLRIKNPNAESWAFIVEPSDENDPLSFSSITIDDLMNVSGKQSIDILKIDIESSEKEVFSADTSWLKNVGTLFIELHDRIKPGCSDVVIASCSKLNYEKEISGEYHVFKFT